VPTQPISLLQRFERVGSLAAMPFSARLDDLRPNRRRSAAFSGFAGEVAATRLAEVGPALNSVEEAAAAGLWAIGYVGYEAAPAFDSNLTVVPRGTFHGDLPLLWFGLYRQRHLNPEPDTGLEDYELSAWECVDERGHFEHDVAAIRERIIAGDTYQVNYTTRLRASFRGDPVAFYHDLAAAQSGGYGTYLDIGRFKIISASPELFFDRYPAGKGTDRLVTRPMKGTAARGRWPAEDEDKRVALESSEKDRAENIIVVDLLRNDVGRVADYGTVAVENLLAIERYDTVWQMTSTITGEVDSSVPLCDVFTALFPCGSITGAPKVRTMEIIADLESEPRGVYTGAIGFVSPPDVPGPRASFSVGIRTVVIDGETGEAEYGVGGGITFGSEPGAEYDEAMLKAQILSYGRSDFELLETLRWSPVAGWYWLDRHLQRIGMSAAYFGVDLDGEHLRGRLEAAVGGQQELRVRVTVGRLGKVRVEAVPLPPGGIASVGVAVDDRPVDVSSPFLFHKTTRRNLYDEALARHPDAEDVILINAAGELTESTIANVVVKLDAKWCTPPVEAGCLPGVYRSVLLEEGTVEERRIRKTDLARCEGLALVNSVRLWRPAYIIDG